MNRQQRRNTEKMKNNKEIKDYVDKFSMDFAKILMNKFEEGKDDKDKLGKEFEEIMKQKGSELGDIVKNKILKKQGKPIKINIK